MGGDEWYIHEVIRTQLVYEGQRAALLQLPRPQSASVNLCTQHWGLPPDLAFPEAGSCSFMMMTQPLRPLRMGLLCQARLLQNRY